MSYTIRQIQRAQQRPDTARDISARIRRNAICAQVRREVDERWPVTPQTSTPRSRISRAGLPS